MILLRFCNLAEKGNSTWTRSASPSYYWYANSGMLTELCCVLTSARAVVGNPPIARLVLTGQSGSSAPFALRPPPGVREASEAECGSRRYPQRWALAGPRQPAEQLRRDSGALVALRLDCWPARCAAGRQRAPRPLES